MTSRDWKVFRGDGSQHDDLQTLPRAPPWRFAGRSKSISMPPAGFDIGSEEARARPFRPTPSMIPAVNAALYLRRPLLITGEPGSGKSTLIAKVAHELKMGPVLRWAINSRSTVRGGIYEYDAIGRLQAGTVELPPVDQYLTLGPVGTALMAESWPHPLLIDEIDKSDLDFANDLLNVIEEGEYDIPELRRIGQTEIKVRNFFGELVTVRNGHLSCSQFPFVVMTSNADREFPPAFLRRCIQLRVERPKEQELKEILVSHLGSFSGVCGEGQGEVSEEAAKVIGQFLRKRDENAAVATDQLLNAVFLTVALQAGEARRFDSSELEKLRETLLSPISGPGG